MVRGRLGEPLPGPRAKVGFDSDGGLCEYYLAGARSLVPITDTPGAVRAMERTTRTAVVPEQPRTAASAKETGNTHTPGQAVRMTGTRGRVVLVGYTGKPSTLDVLEVVVRETEIRGSVGATLADAHTVMRMAEAGLIRGHVEAEYPLEQVDEALARLAAGNVTGRLVISP